MIRLAKDKDLDAIMKIYGGDGKPVSVGQEPPAQRASGGGY